LSSVVESESLILRRLLRSLNNCVQWSDWSNEERSLVAVAVHPCGDINDSTKSESREQYLSRLILRTLFNVRGRYKPGFIKAFYFSLSQKELARLASPAALLREQIMSIHPPVSKKTCAFG